VDGLAQIVASVMVYVCALRIKEVISSSWEKKDRVYMARM